MRGRRAAYWYPFLLLMVVCGNGTLPYRGWGVGSICHGSAYACRVLRVGGDSSKMLVQFAAIFGCLALGVAIAGGIGGLVGGAVGIGLVIAMDEKP
jgi:hypothetical protein